MMRYSYRYSKSPTAKPRGTIALRDVAEIMLSKERAEPPASSSASPTKFAVELRTKERTYRLQASSETSNRAPTFAR